MTARIPGILMTGREVKRHQKAVDEKGNVVGYARWVLPEERRSTGVEWQEAQGPYVGREERERYERVGREERDGNGNLRGVNSGAVEKLSPALEAAEEKILEDGEYLRLDYIAVEPSHQKSGIGSLLLESGITQAEKAGLDCYVMTTEIGLRFFQKHGFVIVTTVAQSVKEWRGGGEDWLVHYFLVRKVIEEEA